MNIDAKGMHFSVLNKQVRESADETIHIENCNGQRYIAGGLSGKTLEIDGTSGNALGSYLNGCSVTVHGNVQEATGDTMNGGEIVVFGSAGDATGYAMRGGKIFVRGDAGYRCGIHMKAYKENKPAIVIGGRAGSFLGEYQAGGIIIVLGETEEGKPIIGNFCGTGMHGGEIWLRTDELTAALPEQVKSERVTLSDEAASLIREWCARFGREEKSYLSAVYYRLTPNADNPYRQMYTPN